MKYYVKSKLSENISVTPEGFLLCRNVLLTHTGKLLYVKGEHPFEDVNGNMTLTRTKDELFSDKTISSFQGKSITIAHPEDWVSPENWSELSHGVVMNIRPTPEQVEVDGEMVDGLLGDFLITTREAIDEVNNGLREVSLGYDALWVQTGDYEAVHTNIIGNHCALVESGRAGIECAIKDSKGEEEMSKSLKEKFQKLMGRTVDEFVADKEAEEKKAADEKEAAEKAAKDAEEAEAKKKADEEAAAKAKKESESKDEDGDLESRIAKLETMLAEVVKMLSGEGEEVVAEDEDMESEEDESEDAGDESDLITDEDESKEGKASDTMARAEILAPGIKFSKDVKVKALEAAMKTTDSAKIIKPLLGGKKISDHAKNIDGIFFAASELLKNERTSSFATHKKVAIDNFPSLQQKGAMTTEQLNKINAERYGKKQ